MGKGGIACYEQFLFPTVLSKDLYCRHVKPRACLGKGSLFPKRQILDSSKLRVCRQVSKLMKMAGGSPKG